MKGRATVSTRVELVLESHAGVFGEDWSLPAVRVAAKRAAQDHVENLVALAATKGIQLRVLKFGGMSLRFEDEAD